MILGGDADVSQVGLLLVVITIPPGFSLFASCLRFETNLVVCFTANAVVRDECQSTFATWCQCWLVLSRARLGEAASSRCGALDRMRRCSGWTKSDSDPSFEIVSVLT